VPGCLDLPINRPVQNNGNLPIFGGQFEVGVKVRFDLLRQRQLHPHRREFPQPALQLQLSRGRGIGAFTHGIHLDGIQPDFDRRRDNLIAVVV